MGGLELRHGLPLGRKPGWGRPLVPPAHDDAAAIARELVGEVLGVADAEDLRAGLTPEAPRRKRHRSQERFQVARWHLMISRRILPSNTAASFAVITSTCQF